MTPSFPYSISEGGSGNNLNRRASSSRSPVTPIFRACKPPDFGRVDDEGQDMKHTGDPPDFEAGPTVDYLSPMQETSHLVEVIDERSDSIIDPPPLNTICKPLDRSELGGGGGDSLVSYNT